eukprot:3607778-Pyramimonas_sp.AAC.1
MPCKRMAWRSAPRVGRLRQAPDCAAWAWRSGWRVAPKREKPELAARHATPQLSIVKLLVGE